MDFQGDGLFGAAGRAARGGSVTYLIRASVPTVSFLLSRSFLPKRLRSAQRARRRRQMSRALARISHESRTDLTHDPRDPHQGPKNPAIAPAPPPAKPALALLPIDDAEKRARVDRAARFASTAAERALQELHYTPLTHHTTLHYTPLQ